MTDLHQKAEELTGPEIVTTSDLPSREPARIDSVDLVGADELTAEGTFPEFGEFLTVGREEEEEEEYWECSTALAALIVDAAEESEKALTDHVVDIEAASKDPSGEWRYVLDVRPVDGD